MFKFILLVTYLFSSLIICGETPSKLYVRVDGAGDGTSWEKACSLPFALEKVGKVGEIYMASGNYVIAGTILVKPDVTIYGGFNAAETNELSPDARNFSAENPWEFLNDTIISSDRNLGKWTWNSLGWTISDAPEDGFSKLAIINGKVNGITFQGGYANSTSLIEVSGIEVNGGVIERCKVQNMYVGSRGKNNANDNSTCGILISGSNSRISQTFIGNNRNTKRFTAMSTGVKVLKELTNIEISECEFSRNHCTRGTIIHLQSPTIISRCNIFNNYLVNGGSCILVENGESKVNNSIFMHNFLSQSSEDIKNALYGGVLFLVNKQGKISATNCNFIRNQSIFSKSEAGNLMGIKSDDSNIAITGSIFYENSGSFTNNTGKFSAINCVSDIDFSENNQIELISENEKLFSNLTDLKAGIIAGKIATEYNFTPHYDSILINKLAWNSAMGNYDFYGYARKSAIEGEGGLVDIGAIEYQIKQIVAPVILPGKNKLIEFIIPNATDRSKYQCRVTSDCGTNFKTEVSPDNSLAKINLHDNWNDTGFVLAIRQINMHGQVLSNWSDNVRIQVTPAFDVNVKLENGVFMWSVAKEDSVAAYKIIASTGSTITTIVADNSKFYSYGPCFDLAPSLLVVDVNGSVQEFTLPAPTIKIVLCAGWNLISVPFKSLNDNEFYSFVDPNIWMWDGVKYVLSEEVPSSPNACWVYSKLPKEVVLSGEKITNLEYNINSGWNLLGPHKMLDLPEHLTVFRWDNFAGKNVEVKDELTLGEGYWVFALEEETLVL